MSKTRNAGIEGKLLRFLSKLRQWGIKREVHHGTVVPSPRPKSSGYVVYNVV